MKGDTNRLPVWAQSKIREMQTRINFLEQQLAREKASARGEAGPGNVFVRGHVLDPDVPIGMNSMIRFHFPKPTDQVTERFIDIRHEHDQERDSLLVQCDATVQVEPCASNSLRLILVRR